MSKSPITVTAVNRRGPPKMAPNPAYPNGVDIVGEGARDRGAKTCDVALPYPAPERLQWLITCEKCGLMFMVSAAGRTDDPKSVRVACLRGKPL